MQRKRCSDPTFRLAAEKIVIYSALDPVTPTVKAFPAKTGIEVNLVRLSTGELLGKITAAGRKLVSADAMFLPTSVTGTATGQTKAQVQDWQAVMMGAIIRF